MRTGNRSRWLVRVAFVVAVVAATSPAWRVLLLGALPTHHHHLHIPCIAPTAV
jgi:hypothetical protein